MARFKKKTGEVEASQWFMHGDHADVGRYAAAIDADRSCHICGGFIWDHGLIEASEGPPNIIVCPGDWIVTGANGEKYSVKDPLFKVGYEKVA